MEICYWTASDFTYSETGQSLKCLCGRCWNEMPAWVSSSDRHSLWTDSRRPDLDCKCDNAAGEFLMQEHPESPWISVALRVLRDKHFKIKTKSDLFVIVGAGRSEGRMP